MKKSKVERKRKDKEKEERIGEQNKLQYRVKMKDEEEIETFWNLMEYIYCERLNRKWDDLTLRKLQNCAERFNALQLVTFCEDKLKKKKEPDYSTVSNAAEQILFDTDVFNDVHFVRLNAWKF